MIALPVAEFVQPAPTYTHTQGLFIVKTQEIPDANGRIVKEYTHPPGSKFAGSKFYCAEDTVDHYAGLVIDPHPTDTETEPQ